LDQQLEVEEGRTLSDADVDAIAAALESRFVERFYGNVGRGVWGLAWRAIVVTIAAIAIYGSVKGMK
jgi:hypothetical protein